MNSTQIEVKLSFDGGHLSCLEVVVDKGFIAKFAFVPHSLLALMSQYANVSPSEFPIKDVDSKLALVQAGTSPIESLSSNEEDKQIVRVWNSKYERDFEDLISKITKGFQNNQEPELCEEGVNGTYFLKDDQGEFIGVFKPHDEEMQSPNNPKKNDNEDDQKVIPLQPGESIQREVAAYLLDHDGFFGVPKTSLVHLEFPQGTAKYGSLQEFVPNDGASWDMGPSVFPVPEVHKIGILDLYMLNLDRHGGNILIKEEAKSYSLIPIDNGFALPDTMDLPDLWFEWLTWPQAKKPFGKEAIEFINRLNVESDIELLRKELGIRDECLEIMRITGALLKMGAALGLTLYDLGMLLCPKPSPDDDGEPSSLVTKLLRSLNIEKMTKACSAVVIPRLDGLLRPFRTPSAPVRNDAFM